MAYMLCDATERCNGVADRCGNRLVLLLLSFLQKQKTKQNKKKGGGGGPRGSARSPAMPGIGLQRDVDL